MLPRFNSVFLALMAALLIVLGTLGIFSAEALTFRATMRDAQVYGQLTTTSAYDDDTDATLVIASPGRPY